MKIIMLLLLKNKNESVFLNLFKLLYGKSSILCLYILIIFDRYHYFKLQKLHL